VSNRTGGKEEGGEEKDMGQRERKGYAKNWVKSWLSIFSRAVSR
jgi:hypothetical protein